MAIDFDLKHAFYGGAGAAIGAIAGYLLGIVLYIVMLSSSAFVPSPTLTNSALTSSSSPIVIAAGNAGVFPMLFAVTLAALGFFAGFYKASTEPKVA